MHRPVSWFITLFVAVGVLTAGAGPTQARAADPARVNTCFATHDNGVTVQSSADAAAVQVAIDLVPIAGTVKVAGTCAGVSTRFVEGGNPANQTAYIGKSLTLQGGYTTDDWSAPDPANVTILDAGGAGRVLLLEDAAITGTMAAYIDLITMRNGNAVYADHQAQTGGGIRVANGAYVVITRSTLSSSTANFGGGGIDNRAHLVLRHSTVHANTANNEGGGIYNLGYLEMAGSTLSTNSAAVGGALRNAGTALIGTSTLYNNAATSSTGGIYNSGTATLDGTLIASSQSGIDCAGVPAASIAYSLLQDGSCGVANGVNGNVVANPVVGALADNGGPTLTHPLVVGSPAIDAGNPNACPTTDQRGFFRDDACDIGAYEFDSGPCMATTGGRAEQVVSLDASAIKAAMVAAGPGGMVKVAGTCAGVQSVAVASGTLVQTLYISRSVTIEGGHTPTDWAAAPDSTLHPTLLDAGGAGRVVVLHDAGGAGGVTVALNHLMLRNGVAPDALLTGFLAAGGLLVHTGVAATVSNSTLEDNTAQLGGGIANYGTLTLNTSTVGNNTVTALGGGLYNVGAATVTNSTIADNVAQNEVGGGIYNGATLIVTGSTISGNRANVSQGGGLYNSGTATVSNSEIARNTAVLHGGGIFIHSNGTLTVNDSTIRSNGSNSSGGGIFSSGIATISRSTVSNNSTAFSGGGISNSGTITIRDSTISGNAIPGNTLSRHGGGISNFGIATIRTSTINGNAASRGGGVANADGTITVSDSVISDNTAEVGGGFYNPIGSITVNSSTLVGNTATNSNGGGIDNNATVTLNNSTLSGNTAAGFGGGMNNLGLVTIRNSTLFANSAVSGGNIYLDSAPADIRNSIIAGNGGGGDCGGFTAGSILFTLMRDGSCGVVNNVNGNIVADPLLDFLLDNGGPTRTHALLPGSPAIGAGDQAICDAAPIASRDQRGFLRDGDCDMGAYEVGAVPTAVTLTALTADSARHGWLALFALLLALPLLSRKLWESPGK